MSLVANRTIVGLQMTTGTLALIIALAGAAVLVVLTLWLRARRMQAMRAAPGFSSRANSIRALLPHRRPADAIEHEALQAGAELVAHGRAQADHAAVERGLGGGAGDVVDGGVRAIDRQARRRDPRMRTD